MVHPDVSMSTKIDTDFINSVVLVSPSGTSAKADTLYSDFLEEKFRGSRTYEDYVAKVEEGFSQSRFSVEAVLADLLLGVWRSGHAARFWEEALDLFGQFSDPYDRDCYRICLSQRPDFVGRNINPRQFGYRLLGSLQDDPYDEIFPEVEDEPEYLWVWTPVDPQPGQPPFIFTSDVGDLGNLSGDAVKVPFMLSAYMPDDFRTGKNENGRLRDRVKQIVACTVGTVDFDEESGYVMREMFRRAADGADDPADFVNSILMENMESFLDMLKRDDSGYRFAENVHRLCDSVPAEWTSEFRFVWNSIR